jgi:hypothetical protein
MFFAKPGLGEQKKMEFDTMLRMEANYQDNVFLSENDPQGGYTTSVIPGICFYYTTKRSRTDLEYKANVKYFSYDVGQSGTFSDERYDIFHEAQLHFESRMRPRGQKGLFFFLDEYYLDNQTISQLTEPSRERQNKYFTNTLQPLIGLELSRKTSLLAKYENEIVRFKRQSANHSLQHTYRFDIEYYKSRRTFFSLGFQQIYKDFSETADYSVNEGELGFRRIFNKTWSGGLTLSYQVRDFAQDAKVADWSGPTVTAYLKAIRKKKLNVEFTYQNKRNSFDSSVSYRIDRWDLKNQWNPTKKLSLNLTPFYQKDTYDHPAGRRDSLWGFKSQFTLQPKKHISLGIGYDHADRDSNKKEFRYKNNIYYLFFTIKTS